MENEKDLSFWEGVFIIMLLLYPILIMVLFVLDRPYLKKLFTKFYNLIVDEDEEI